MPEKTLKKLNNAISPNLKVCFFAALVVGLVAHFYKITNWLPNWDSLVFRYDSQNMVGLGRWFLPVVCSFSSFYDLPFLNGLIAIIFHALGGVVICKTLGLKSKVACVLVGATVVSFPSVTSIMMYNYVADGYSIAFFLSSLAAYLLTREKPKYIIAAILIALSVGIYQAYITVTIMLCLIKLIDRIVFGSMPFGVIIKRCAFMLLTGIGGMALYGIVLKIILSLSSTSLLDYQGINSSASFLGLDLLASLYVIKETFIKCFFDFERGINLYIVLNVLLFAFTVICFIKAIIKRKLYKKPALLCLLILLVVMLPVGATALAFVNASVDYHSLMHMGYVVFYLFFILLYERDCDSCDKSVAIKKWIVLLLACLLIANQVVIANVSYHKAQIAYEKSYGVLIRIDDRIEQTEGAKDCEKIVVIGALDNSEQYSANLTPNITGITDGYILRADDETVGQSVLCSALNDYCDKNYKFLSGEEKNQIIEKEEVKKMEKWPAESCVMVIDDTVIIKLGDNQ